MNRIPNATLMISLLLVGGCNSDGSPSPDPADAKVSIILTAFGDKDGTFGETQPYLQALTNLQDRTADFAFCKGVYEGMLSGQPVVITTTGTGGDNAGPCMQELLYQYGSRMKEVIWSGIGGATPAVGGLVDRTGKMRDPVEPVMIGDVCISALTWNYDLHFSSVTDWVGARRADDRYNPAGGWWPMKDSNGQGSVIGFENVQQSVIADRALADELTTASGGVAWPAIDNDVLPKIQRYFRPDQIRATRVFDSSQCGEVAGNNFWHGVVEDRLSRQYLAGLIAASGYGPATITEDEVVVFSAMEAPAWMSVLARWSQHRGVSIPMAVVRAASNYDHIPLDAQGNPKPEANGQVLTAMEDILLGFEESGAAFAWHNAARPVLKLFEMRRLPR
jgi:purine nucleoside permease